mgnify:CR=1 FL=1
MYTHLTLHIEIVSNGCMYVFILSFDIEMYHKDVVNTSIYKFMNGTFLYMSYGIVVFSHLKFDRQWYQLLVYTHLKLYIEKCLENCNLIPFVTSYCE